MEKRTSCATVEIEDLKLMPKWYVTAIETRIRRGVFHEVEAPTQEEAERLVRQEKVQPDEIDTLQCSLEVETAERVLC